MTTSTKAKSTIKLACMAFRSARKFETEGNIPEMEKKLDMAARLEREARADGDESMEYNLDYVAPVKKSDLERLAA